ncbi:hypothetical protein K1X76_13025 [bacterium]|nr:hypothetical protein [bacterium]
MQDLEAAFHNLFTEKILGLFKSEDVSEAELSLVALIDSLDQAFYEALFNPLLIDAAQAREVFLSDIKKIQDAMDKRNISIEPNLDQPACQVAA